MDLPNLLSKVEETVSESVLTAVVRGRVEAKELSKFIPAACGEVWSFARSAQLPRPGRHIALYLEGGWVEVGAEVSERFVGNDRVQCSKLPGGRVATAIHLGPYPRLGDTHTKIRRWCAEQALPLTGVCWEIYGNWDESWNQDSSKIRTDVFYQIDDRSPPEDTASLG